jgi:hypothetical protein
LVCAKLDRITRSVSDLCGLIDFCQANGKSLVSIAESFDLGTPSGRMVATILASVAAFERERTAERRREAAEWLRKHARYGGGVVPFGYKPEALPEGGGGSLRTRLCMLLLPGAAVKAQLLAPCCAHELEQNRLPRLISACWPQPSQILR